MPMRTGVGIAVGGAVGALCRYWLEGMISRRAGAFPWGTFVVNASGAFLLGLLFTVLTDRLAAPGWLRSTLTIGLLGAYTTFSTLALESFRMLEDGAVLLGLANAIGSLAAGLVAVYAGIVVGRVI